MRKVAARVEVTLLTAAVSLGVMFGAGCKKDPPPPPPPPSPAAALAQAAAALEQAGKNLPRAGNGAPAGAQQGQVDMAQAMKAMGMALNGGQQVEPVNFRELKALLPQEVSGWKLTGARGEKNGALGLSRSEASGRYEGPEGASLRIKILDLGSLSGPMALGLAGWASMEVDRESDSGYEKTTTFQGRKAVEKYNTGSKHGELKVLLASRFIVEVDGYKMAMDDVKAAAGKLDLNKLEALK